MGVPTLHAVRRQNEAGDKLYNAYAGICAWLNWHYVCITLPCIV